MGAIHRNTRPGKAAMRTGIAAANMPAAKTGMRAAKAATTEAAMTAAATTATVACCQCASRHRRRADCYSRNERNNFIPHYTLLLTTDRPEQQRSHDTLGCRRGAASRPNDAEHVTSGNVGRLDRDRIQLNRITLQIVRLRHDLDRKPVIGSKPEGMLFGIMLSR
jgi:hypothetical protein